MWVECQFSCLSVAFVQYVIVRDEKMPNSIKIRRKLDCVFLSYIQLQGVSSSDPLIRGYAPGLRWGHLPRLPLWARATALAIAPARHSPQITIWPPIFSVAYPTWCMMTIPAVTC